MSDQEQLSLDPLAQLQGLREAVQILEGRIEKGWAIIKVTTDRGKRNFYQQNWLQLLRDHERTYRAWVKAELIADPHWEHPAAREG